MFIYAQSLLQLIWRYSQCDTYRLPRQPLNNIVRASLVIFASAVNNLIYVIQVLNEFTHGKQETVNKTEFKEVLSDILLGMAAGLKRDPVVILRIDGEDLLEFITGPTFEADILSTFSQIDSNDGSSLRDHIIKVLEKLSVDQGMPPSSDPWVIDSFATGLTWHTIN